MMPSSFRTGRVFALAAFAASVVAACGSSGNESMFPPPGGIDGGTGFDTDATFKPREDAGDIWANDPPPQWCGPDGGGTPPTPPGGTPECPDDKNREGCPCDKSKIGQTAPCWPGLRANRNLGICKDGTTTCVSKGEGLTAQWGACTGYVLPQPGAKKGKEACKCFSQGQWKIENLSPCFFTWNGTTTYALSTIQNGNTADCPNVTSAPPPKPAQIWSKDTLTVDCAGHFKLCYELKVGKAATPQPADCSLYKACVEADYLVANQTQPFPDLDSWVGTDTACAAQAVATDSIYGEMTVIGKSVLCDIVDDGAGNPYVFNRVQYCPLKCTQPGNQGLPECQNCLIGGSGTF
jgi:hypothetical protein